MDDRLENLIRQWASAGRPPASAPARPTRQCLTYEQAMAVVADGQAPDGQAAEHIRTCLYCQRLLADFQDALADSAARGLHGASPGRVIRMLRPVGMALAASLILAAGIALFFASQRRPAGPLLASAAVGLQSQIQADLLPKAPQSFATGQVIMFRVELRTQSYVTLISLDPRGRLTALPPTAASGEAVQRLPAGLARLGPYGLDETTGRETFFLVAAGRPITDLHDKIERLQTNRDRGASADRLAKIIGAWPADVKTISFDHVPPQP